MTDLKEWIDRNANRPLALATGTVLCLQLGYLGYLAHNEYSAQLRAIDRVVETASLGIQQDNRPLIEATLLTGLRNADAATVALCRGAAAELIYPPSAQDPCRATDGGIFRWLVRRKAMGPGQHDFVFIINGWTTFAPLAVIFGITIILSLAIISILIRARRRFAAEILDPLRQGLAAEKPLGISELEELRRKNQEHIALSRNQAVAAALFDFSAQVAHDIRSPLAVLEIVSNDPAQWEKKRAMLRNAISRLSGIANSVLIRYRTTETGKEALASETSAFEHGGPTSVQLLSSLIDSVVSTKPIEFGPGVEIGVEYDSDSYGLFAQVQRVEFQRVLSNLINNAVEALAKGPGWVRVALSSVNGEISVRVKDNGKGIPPEILAKLGQRGASYGKEGGHGRGLHHARSCAESWGGRLEIESPAQKGATVALLIPSADAPDWFATEVSLLAGAPVVILDDDPNIHDIWRKRLVDANAVVRDIRACYFLAPDDLRNWVNKNQAEALRATYLLDYELGEGAETGLDIATELGLLHQAILVTGRHDDDEVMAICKTLGIRLFPKELARLVPFRIRESDSPAIVTPVLFDAVLIDDDPLTRMTWQNEASESGKRFRAFSSSEAFIRGAAAIDFRTPVYVDAKLADGIDGAEESLRIHALGFGEIYLATGHPAERFANYQHLRGVVDKVPPWNANPGGPKSPASGDDA
ncbi:MAG: HAMP domain-containing histidine kinase [Elusimicrobia bacterium]|nr:HAMP domain-containing histidine kinase [Elusimicrobiota bacterium]